MTCSPEVVTLKLPWGAGMEQGFKKEIVEYLRWSWVGVTGGHNSRDKCITFYMASLGDTKQARFQLALPAPS